MARSKQTDDGGAVLLLRIYRRRSGRFANQADSQAIR
jgi:hypothetical protein